MTKDKQLLWESAILLKFQYCGRFRAFLERLAYGRENVIVIATGSATSWMRDKLVGNKGGLHARVTCQLHLAPFTVRETEKYLKSREVFWDRYQILQSYMLLDRVPYYYSILISEKSLTQNIDILCFRSVPCSQTQITILIPSRF